jgi:hypothetical protein
MVQIDNASSQPATSAHIVDDDLYLIMQDGAPPEAHMVKGVDRRKFSPRTQG